ncbi:MAG: TatD family hydrolase, partial [Coriobacteriia bacterium]|nr:TatD family hydrolase [Coriobacteriia bacterium]
MRQINNVASDAAELVAEDNTYWDSTFRDTKGRPVDPVTVHGAPIADTHCHLDMLPHPELAIARAAVHGVRLIIAVVDPTEGPEYTYTSIDSWVEQAGDLLEQWEVPDTPLPEYRLIIGCHPHNASKFNDSTLATVAQLAADPRTTAIGEIGLDYHYDASPRDAQRRVFIHQLRLAHEARMPVSLHLRDAHADGFQILEQEGWPAAGVLLHCYTMDIDTLQPFLDKGASVAFGGTMTFKNAVDLQEAVRQAPLQRI